MFDIGFLELVIVSVVGLLVLGPERLPGAIRTVSLYVGKIRSSFSGIRAEIERELRTDEIRQDLHNQAIMQELRQTERELRQGLNAHNDVKLGKDGYPIEDTPGSETAAADGVHDGDAKDASSAATTSTSKSEAADAQPDESDSQENRITSPTALDQAPSDAMPDNRDSGSPERDEQPEADNQDDTRQTP